MSDEEVPTKRRKSLIMDRSMLDFQNMIDNTEEFMEKEIEQLPIRLAENNYLTKSGWPIENNSEKSGWPIKKLFKQIKLANKLIYLNKSGWPIKNILKNQVARSLVFLEALGG